MDDRHPAKLACLLIATATVCGCAAREWTVAKLEPGHAVAAAPFAETTLPIRRLPPPSDPASDVELVAYEEAQNGNDEPKTTEIKHAQSIEPIVPPVLDMTESQTYPIDLGNALRLGGASNLEIRIARSRIAEAQARYLRARTLWLPSLRFGVGYNKHDGRIQETEGNVLEVSRGSLFFGGGAGLGHVPLAGGSSGPFRLAVNLSLADAAFAPLVECQLVSAASAASNAALNDNLLAIASAYFGLVEANGQLANERLATAAAKQTADQVEAFARAGESSKTEVERVRTELALREQRLVDAERRVTTASAELARLLRLPPQVELVPVEEFVLPVTFFEAGEPVDGLIALARTSRPEVAEASARLQAACWRTKQETFRPWLPNVQAGASGGTFGGGTGSDLVNYGGRSDVDLLAVWELQNVGAGNIALRREAASQCHQRELELAAVRDQAAADVVSAHADVVGFHRQLEVAESAIGSAEESYQLNLSRIRQGEGLPIELIQSLNAMARALEQYTSAVANYNRAQYRLMRAVGMPPEPPDETADR